MRSSSDHSSIKSVGFSRSLKSPFTTCLRSALEADGSSELVIVVRGTVYVYDVEWKCTTSAKIQYDLAIAVCYSI